MQDYFEYFPCGPTELAWGFHISAAGYTRIKRGAPYPPARHPDSHAFVWSDGRILSSLQVVYLSSGSGQFESRQGGPHEVRTGDAMILWPGVWHRYRPQPRTGWTEHWFELSGHLVPGWLKNLDPSVSIISAPQPDQMLEQFQKLHAFCQKKPRGGRLQAATWALAIWAELLAGSVQEERIDHDGLIQRAVRKMTSSLTAPVRIEKIARDLGVSYPTLHRHFTAETGLSPKQYFEQVRLARAAELLTASRLSIKEIAASLGYYSAFHFSHHFKLNKGMAPSLWRSRAGDSGEES